MQNATSAFQIRLQGLDEFPHLGQDFGVPSLALMILNWAVGGRLALTT